MKNKGFTLIELLVVIAVVAILSVAVILSLNPTELMRQSRDSLRISDLNTVNRALGLYITSVNSAALASSTCGGGNPYSCCYLSTTQGNGTTTAKCGVFAATYSGGNGSSTATNYKNIDSAGWIPVNFKQLSFSSVFDALPVDPTNNTTYYYSYAATAAGGYKLTAFLESTKYAPKELNSSDGGTNDSAYEIGNNLAL